MPIESSSKYNTKIKVYPDGQSNITYCNRQIFSPKKDKDRITEIVEDSEDILKLDDISDCEDVEDEPSDKEHPEQKNIVRALKRAKEKVFDICYCNEWQYFLTITIDPSQMDSQDTTVVMKKLNTWLQNQVFRRGLKYILVPERHKKGGIHCHALINDCFTLEDSGRVRIGKKSYKREYCDKKGFAYTDKDIIYNLPQWTYGWSTALQVYDSGAKLATYITKYVTKGNDKIFGRFYWSSRNIIREPDIMYANSEFDLVEAETHEVPNTEYTLKYESNIIYELKSKV